MKLFKHNKLLVILASMLTMVFSLTACQNNAEEPLMLQSIALTHQPEKTNYFVGEYLDKTGIEVTARFTQNVTRVINNYSVDKTGPLQLDDNKVTLSYTYENVTKTISYAINVVNVRLESISIEHLPNKTTYFEGENFAPEGLIINAHYSDESSSVIEDYTIDCDGPLTQSNTSITVSYTEIGINKTVSFPITVNKVELKSISVDHLPNITNYFEGESLNKNGLVVTAHFTNDTSAPIENYNLSCSDVLTLQDSNITVSYTQGSITKTASFNLTINKVLLESISIDKMPTKIEYDYGESFVKDGMVVSAHYNNETTSIIENYVVNAPLKLTPSNNSISISYTSGEITKTVNFTVSVHAEEITRKYVYTPHSNDVLPTIKINTPSGTDWVTNYNRNNKLAGQIEYVNATVTTENGTKDKYNFTDAVAKVKVRGNWTLNYEKKPIRIKYEEKHVMFGMNNDFKAKNWVLLAEWKDLSMLNNSTALYLGHTILGNDGYYNTDFMYVDVYINNNYWGVYLLAEQQEVKSSRFNITEADEGNPEDLNIGYLVEFDQYYNEESSDITFTLDYADVVYKDINNNRVTNLQPGFTIQSDIYSQAQNTQIKNYIYNCLKIIYQAVTNKKYYKMSDDYSTLVESEETNAYNTINAYVDMESLIDYFIIEEIVRDPDLQITSFYVDCDLNEASFKPLTFEGLWDFDSALGIRNGWTNTDGIYSFTNQNGMNPFLGLFSHCDWFLSLVEQKWNLLLKDNVFNDTLTFIETCKDKYHDAYVRNFERWPSRITSGNDEVVWQVNTNRTEEDAANYLIGWFTERVKKLTKIFTGKDFKTTAEIEAEQEVQNLIVGKTSYRYEAESGQILNCTAKTDATASNGSYLSQVSGATDRGFIATVNANQAIENAVVFIGCSKRASSFPLATWFKVVVNDVEYTIDSTNYVPAMSQGETEWHAWDSFYACKINLKQGENKVKIVTSTTEATNLDYIDIYSTIALS